MIPRQAADTLLEKASYYPVLAITGPRQSGKSTLAKSLFASKPYCSLEDHDTRQFATEDPRRFLAQFSHGAVLDEVQHCPELFSYLQTIVDAQHQQGLFILTSSQQFGFLAKITQSLAGRVGFIQLLPLTLSELQHVKQEPQSLEDLLFNGLYPSIYQKKIPPNHWFSDYIMTYIERDVRQLINIQDLTTFRRFLQMCAMRTGQLLNLSSLASDCGITHNTAKAWISVLEASYILYLLPPHFKNFNKRLTKSPKLYFYDTGLACALMGIQHSAQLITHSHRGAIFETWVIGELIKQRYNKGLLSNLYFWRDSQGHEVDVIAELGEALLPVEIKSGQTITDDYFKGLAYWQKLNGALPLPWLVYAGNSSQTRRQAEIISWQNISSLCGAIT